MFALLVAVLVFYSSCSLLFCLAICMLASQHNQREEQFGIS